MATQRTGCMGVSNEASEGNAALAAAPFAPMATTDEVSLKVASDTSE